MQIQINDILKFFSQIKSIVPENAWSKLIEKERSNVPQEVFSEIIANYPGWSEDEKRVIAKLGLGDPKKMFEFVFDAFLTGFEVCSEGIANIEKTLLDNEISKVNAVVEKLQDCDDSDDTESLIKSYIDDMIEVISNLEEKIKDYIERVQATDNLSSWKFFMKSKSLLPQTNNNVQCVKAALQAYFQAIGIYSMLANQRHGLQSKKHSDYLEKRNEFLNGLNTPLMLAYDVDKEGKNFWNIKKFNKKLDDIRALNYTVQQFLADNTETELDWENIEW